MMSGRGLGHTGGTLDKLESIPGFRTALTLAQAEKQIARIGCAMLGQTDEIVPADRKIYALRDATATVEVIPLIAASIMSKKIAESLTGLVLDIKRGSGSFLPELEQEIQLAQAMIDLGVEHACPVVALVTAIGSPTRPRLWKRARGRGSNSSVEGSWTGGPDRGHLRPRR